MCASLKVAQEVSTFTAISVFDLMTTVRLLYAGYWRDFGLVNEDFVVCFLKTFLVFSGLAFLIPFNLFELYLRPDYFFCVGLRQEPKTALQLLRLNPVLRASYIYCFLAWAYIRRRRDALNDLQRTPGVCLGTRVRTRATRTWPPSWA